KRDEKGKNRCTQGHELEQVAQFLPMVIGLTIAWPVWRAVFVIAGLVYAPLEQFWGYGLLAWLFIVVWMPIKGTAYFVRGGPVRQLSAGCYGMAVGSVTGMIVTGVALMLLFGRVSLR